MVPLAGFVASVDDALGVFEGENVCCGDGRFPGCTGEAHPVMSSTAATAMAVPRTR